MARPGLMRHRKFARLARLLGSKSTARGHLELLWDAAYEAGDELLGNAGDVEFLAEWSGEEGFLARALVEAGFLDQEGDNLSVHDLWDHAPDYVRKRRSRESERKAKGERLENGGQHLTGQCPVSDRSESGQRPDTDRSVTGHCPPNGRTRTPTPTPIRKTKHMSADADAAGLDQRDSPPVPEASPPAAPPQQATQPAEEPKPADRLGEQVREVFEHWRRVMHKTLPTKLDGKRRRVVEARLREGYTVAQLCRAVDGCAATPHNMGANDRGIRYDDLELICRDSPHVDRFMATAESRSPPESEPEPDSVEHKCSLCGRRVGRVGRRVVGEDVLCILHAMELEAAPGRPTSPAAQGDWDRAWLADRLREAA